MPYEHQGMKIWVEPDKRIGSGNIEQGSDVHLMVGVEPADASNRVQVKYSVNSGPTTAVDAEPLRHVGNTQFFQVKLPSATLREGDVLEYGAVCQCAGRQVSSAYEADPFSSSIQVMNGKVLENRPAVSHAVMSTSSPTSITADQRIKTLSTTYPASPPANTPVDGASPLKPTHLSLFVSEKNKGCPISHIPFYAEIYVSKIVRPQAFDDKLEGANAQPQKMVWKHPLGILATDHVGYLSFDLTRIPPDVTDAVALALEAHRQDTNSSTDSAIWIYPMGREESRINALSQMRFAHDAIVVKLELDLQLDPLLCKPEICECFENLGLPAMQNPTLTDWKLSPASIATNSSGLIGADGCEMVLPSDVAVHEFSFHQVIGVPAAEVGLTIDPAASDKVRPGFVNEYRLRFVPIGHALGNILYSFPLAPGESVNFSVIDWSRRDSALRNESTKLDESLVHELRRDRVISETVKASIDEWQRGGSIMGGLATSAGGAIGGSGMGAAAGASNAIGGAYSTTSGSRDIAGDTMQKLSDNVVQAATSSRELHSTVVVQSSQAEHEAIETRTVVNYNHSHALTILYYEVLRHFRVVTEFVRRRPALLTNIHGGIAYRVTPDTASNKPPYDEIWWPAIYENRRVLEAALLDDRYKECFDIIERRRHRDFLVRANPPPPPPPPPPIKTPPDPPPSYGPEIKFFVFDMMTGGWNSDEPDRHVQIHATLWPKKKQLFSKDNKPRLNPPGAFHISGLNESFVGMLPSEETIHWGDIDLIQFWIYLHNRHVSFQHIKVTGIDIHGNEHKLIDKGYESGHLTLNNNCHIDLPTFRTQPPPPPPGRPVEEIEEEAKLSEFTEHLLNNRAHYERALRLESTPAQRAFELAGLGVGAGSSLLEKVDNRPLEVLGNYVAYPCTDPVWSKKIMDTFRFQAKANELPEVEKIEQLLTFPTRGVFAEAKLGHCNASEEIDNTRFWKWDEHPVPHLAPDIEAIQAGQHIVKDLNLQPTPFPQPMVNIVNPPNAPDPQGMTAAMNALATANIFRDMSGRAELADLLKKLSDNSVAIAGVAQKAAMGGKAASSGSPEGGGGGTSPTSSDVGESKEALPSSSQVAAEQNPAPVSSQPTPEQKVSQRLENQNKALQMGQDLLKPTQQDQLRRAVTKSAVNEIQPPLGLGFVITFQRAVYGKPVDGTAKILIKPFGKRKSGFNYGTTIGAPSAEEQTTIPETFEMDIADGTVMFRTDHATAPGTIKITAIYGGSTDSFVQVIRPGSLYNPATNTFTLEGNRDYSEPKSGGVVVLEVTPRTLLKKITSKNTESAMSELGTEVTADYKVGIVKATGKVGKTSSGEDGLEFDVTLLTGGLNIEPK